MLRKLAAIVPIVLLLFCHVTTRAAVPPEQQREAFGVLYTAWISAGQSEATVRVRLTERPEWVRWIRFRAPTAQYADFKGGGAIEQHGEEITWRPDPADAWLQYRARLENRRSSGAFDARVTEDWALFRGEDLVPIVRVDFEDGKQSRAKLRLNVPEGWNIVTAYRRYKSGRLHIDNPHSHFDRPGGWILLGKTGVRRETIGNTRVAVAAPVGENVHRLDIMAFFHFTFPVLQQIFPRFPQRLLVVSAGDPMWRGALSGPASLYVHAERPLISENATSTFIHELVHVAMRARSRPGADWIVEGLAEYYSLETLRRSGAISAARYQKAHRALADWGREATTLAVEHSSGATTARAVSVLRELDGQIRELSSGRSSLDDVVREMAHEAVPVTTERFRDIVMRIAGGEPGALRIE